MASWLELAWEDDAQRRFQERFRYEHPDLERELPLAEALREGYRDGLAYSYGRRFVGFAGEHADVDLASIEPLLAPAGTDGVLPEIDRVRWWEHKSCFGTGTTVGADLRSCAATNEQTARDAAVRMTAATLQGGQLYPVTALAIPFVIELLDRDDLLARTELESWLEQLRTSVREDAHASPRRLAKAMAALRATFSWVPALGEDLATSMESHVIAARECAAVLARYQRLQ